MEEESFIAAYMDTPENLSGNDSRLYVFRVEDFVAWYRRVRDAHEREVDVGVDSMTDADLAEHGLVRMPVDAEGKPIRIGDVMDKGEVTCIRDCGKGWEVVLNNLYTYDTPSLHHHALTVEDVLREFTDEVWNRCCEGATASDSGIDGLVAECAAKLRLAGEDE